MTAVYVVRHAKAKNRLKWQQPDHLRPLTKAGLAQAEALPAHYEGQPFSRLISSPHVRCVQTLEPLAKARGLPLELAEELGEGASAGDALELMLALARAGPAALCTHADVLVDAVEELLTAGIRLDGPLEFKKAATWVFEVRDGTFSSGRYVSPPLDDGPD